MTRKYLIYAGTILLLIAASLSAATRRAVWRDAPPQQMYRLPMYPESRCCDEYFTPETTRKHFVLSMFYRTIGVEG